jgi:MOSC domain-containing protein YiiM
MEGVVRVSAVAGQGLDADASSGRTRRQVLLVSEKNLLDLGLKPGDVRENVVLQGVTVEQFEAGDRLVLGEAVLEITMDCQPCERMDEVRPGLRALIQGRRGMLAKVIVSGTIQVGDEVRGPEPLRSDPAALQPPPNSGPVSPKATPGGSLA